MAGGLFTYDMSRDPALAWFQQSGIGNMDKAAAIDALRSMYAGADTSTLAQNPIYDEGFTGQSYYLTPEARLASDPTQFGNYVGTWQDGNLSDVSWQQRDASGGWFSDNLEWLGPLIVGGAAMAGAGGLLPSFDGGASLSGSIGTTDLLGGAAGDTLGATTAESFLSQAPAYDSLVSGAMPQSIAGSGLGAGIGANGILGAMAAAPAIGTGAALTQAASGLASDLFGNGVGSAVGSALGSGGLGNLAGAALGALASGSAQGGTTTANKEPWGPTQDWLKSLIGQGQALQQQYTQTPFSAQQQAQYSNLFGDIANFRNAAPGLFSFSQNAMTSPGFQRQAREIPAMPTVNLPFPR